MSHHGRTPASVLNAPKPTATVVSPQTGHNRAERRRLTAFVDKSGDVDQLVWIRTRGVAPKGARMPATNVPFTGKVKDALAELEAKVETRRSVLSRVKSLVTFGGGRRSREQAAPVESFKGSRILGRGRAGSR